MMTDDEIIAVVQAKKAGKKIEYHKHCWIAGAWESTDRPSWNFAECDFRVKPEPRDWWTNEYSTGIDRYLYDSPKRADEHSGPDRLRRVHVCEVIDEQDSRQDAGAMQEQPPSSRRRGGGMDY